MEKPMTQISKEELIKQEGNYKAFEYKGYKCRILRPHKLMSQNSNMIFLCGYVLIPKGHLAYGKHYDDIDVSVHGGLTYAEEYLFVQPEKGWWIGFDCGHAGDLCYEGGFGFIDKEDVYRDMNYVEKELKSLVDQLIKMDKLARKE